MDSIGTPIGQGRQPEDGAVLDDSATIRDAVNQVLSRTQGRLYALFNNGAYTQVGAMEDLSRTVLRAQLETNLFGWHELTCLLIPIMRNQGYGRIVQVQKQRLQTFSG